MACIDLHAMACICFGMSNKLHTALVKFMGETGLSAHRVGILAVGNGRLIERLDREGRLWPETEQRAWAFLMSDKARDILTRKARRLPNPGASSVDGAA